MLRIRLRKLWLKHVQTAKVVPVQGRGFLTLWKHAAPPLQAFSKRNRLITKVSQTVTAVRQAFRNGGPVSHSLQLNLLTARSMQLVRGASTVAACGSTAEAPAAEEEHHDAGGLGGVGLEVARRKNVADDATRDGKWASALLEYESLLEHADVCASPQLRGAIASNAALCLLKLCPTQRVWARVRQMLRRVVTLCDEALRIEPGKAKAHYRRGCALEALEDFSGAQAAYEKARFFAPGDKTVRGALERALCYEVGGKREPQAVVPARARLLASDPACRGFLQPNDKPVYLLTACCHCSADAAGSDHFAAPCGHGPFCDACRDRIDGTETAEGSLLRFCPVCRRHGHGSGDAGVIVEWRRGMGELLKAPAAAGGIAGTSKRTGGELRKKMHGLTDPTALVAAIDADKDELDTLVDGHEHAGIDNSTDEHAGIVDGIDGIDDDEHAGIGASPATDGGIVCLHALD